MTTTKHVLFAVITGTLLSACNTTAPAPPGFGITVTNQRFATQIDMIVRGKAFTPNGHVTINIFGHPTRGDIGPLTTTAKADGTFERRESFAYATVPRSRELANIRITVRDDNSGNAAADNFSAEPYVVRSP
jgi:predicted small secreted protein